MNKHTYNSQENNLKRSNQESKALTRNCIRTALIYLIQDIPLKDISVTAIVKRAGVSRAGFYRNYTCKEDVLTDISNNLYQKLLVYFKEELYPLAPYERYVKLFERMKERKDIFMILLTSEYHNNSIFDFQFFISQQNSFENPEEHYAYIGMVYAHRFIIRDWFQNGMKESPEKMAEILCNLFTQKNA